MRSAERHTESGVDDTHHTSAGSPAPFNVRVGSLVVGISGVTFAIDALGSALPAFVVSDETRPDFFVEVTCGPLERPPGISRIISFRADRAKRALTIELSEWIADFDLAARRVLVTLGGPWVSALESLLKTAVQVFGIELRSALFLHGCSVAREERGYGFIGRSGAGKSTVGLLSVEAGLAELLREEITCVGGLGGDGPLTVSTLPTREKNRVSATRPLRYPLAAIYWLVQADADEVRSVPLDDQIRFLAAAATIGVRDRMLMLPALDLAGEIAARVPVKVLRFRKSAGFWAAIDADLERDGATR